MSASKLTRRGAIGAAVLMSGLVLLCVAPADGMDARECHHARTYAESPAELDAVMRDCG